MEEVDDGDQPRSIKKITSLMSYRGSTINAEYAEAFQIIFNVRIKFVYCINSNELHQKD